MYLSNGRTQAAFTCLLSWRHPVLCRSRKVKVFDNSSLSPLQPQHEADDSVPLTSPTCYHNIAVFLFHMWSLMNNFFLQNGIERDVGDSVD